MYEMIVIYYFKECDGELAVHFGGSCRPLRRSIGQKFSVAHAKLPHYPARSASKPRAFGQVRYLTCTAGTDPLYPVNRL